MNIQCRVFDPKLKTYNYFDIRESFGNIPEDLKDNIDFFTGLHDINNNPIYQNDWIESFHSGSFQVKYNSKVAAFQGYSENRGWIPLNQDYTSQHCKVIRHG